MLRLPRRWFVAIAVLVACFTTYVYLYYSERTGDLVGGFIKGVRHNLLERFPGMRIYFEGDAVKVACLLQGPAFQAGDEMVQKTYKDLIERLGQDLSAELQPC